MTSGHRVQDWKDRHLGETIIVCGCGASLAELKAKPPCPVIGVNDVGRAFDPDYLVILNPESQFAKERFAAVRATRPKALFTSVRDLNLPDSPVVRMELGKRGGVAITPDGRVPFTRNSPYVALALARYMGARRIGLIGVDFTQNHFFGQTGQHALARELHSIDREYRRLVAAAAKDGVEVKNLSAQSKLTSIPKTDLQSFLQDIRPTRHVLHISLTNCAGAIWNLHRLMNRSGQVESRVATASPITRGVFRNRTYPKDILWTDREAFEAAIKEADILHFHNFVDAESPALRPYRQAMQGKPSVLQVHSEPAVLSRHFPGRDPVHANRMPVLVVAQKQARFYPNATPVLNAIDPGDYASRPGASAPAPGLPRVVFTPTDLADYPQVPPTCRGKGYRATRRILDRLAKQNLIQPAYGFDLDMDQLLYLTAGASARIDECVTGGYHISSLEGLAHGLATFAWLDPETRALIARMTGSDEATLPWVSVPMSRLETQLKRMAQSADAFAKAGEAGRAWMQKHWTADTVLRPIIEVYGGLVPKPGSAKKKPRPTETRIHPQALPRDIRASIPSRTVLRRSEDYPQTVHLRVALLARQDSARGKAVHILGNGPSVIDADFARMKDDIVIGVNAAVLLRKNLGRAFDYFCVSDRRFLSSDEGRRMAEQAGSATRLFAGYCTGILPSDAGINFVRIIPGDTASFDIVKGFHHCCSVVLFAAQLAGWLGASDIRLYGMECDYRQGHFHESRTQAPKRNHDTHIFPRVEKSAAALAARLADSNRRLTVVGPSRLTGDFGGTAVPGIGSEPLHGKPPMTKTTWCDCGGRSTGANEVR